MAKKRLSKKQIERIKKNQSEHNDKDEIALVISSHGKLTTIENKQKEILVVKRKQNLEVVAGDIVTWLPEDEVITSMKERKSVLVRPDKNKVIAANLEQMLIVCAAMPKVGKTTIEQYLITAHLNNLEPVIIFNKTDLSEEKEVLKMYEELGYKVIYSSVKKNESIQQIINVLKDKSSVIVGQSGVGKSSIVNSIAPELNIKVGAEGNIKTGKHTTTSSTLYHLPFGGNIIDSPGVHNFPLPKLSPNELLETFPECKDLLGECKFKNCNHQNQLGCRVEEAVGNEILEERYETIQFFLEQMN